MERKHAPKSADGLEQLAQTPENDTPENAHPVLRMQQAVGNQGTMRRLAQSGTNVQRVPDGLPDLATQQARQEERAKQQQRKEEYDQAAATPLNTFDDLITLVQRVEAAYPGENWQGVVTRIRKSYYDGFLWDSMIADRSSYGGLAWPPLAVGDFKAFATAKNHPELKVNGESIDIGHVFTGLDAMNFPKTGLIMGAAGVEGPPGATWGGDVGSALAEWDLSSERKDDEREKYYQKLASNDDMLGDVDGIAITQKPADIPADKLSERLRWYYQGLNGGKSGASQRFTKFCQASGFNWTGKGAGIQLDAAARKHVRDQINEFAIAWREKGGGVPGFNWFHDKDLDWFTNRFVSWVQNGLAAENP
jgi:hypothetical protein